MTNIFPGMFEDGYLKVFTESVNELSEAKTEKEIEQAVRKGFSALESVGNTTVRESSKQRLRFMKEQAQIRISKK